jgi:hypothetical protein
MRGGLQPVSRTSGGLKRALHQKLRLAATRKVLLKGSAGR